MKRFTKYLTLLALAFSAEAMASDASAKALKKAKAAFPSGEWVGTNGSRYTCAVRLTWKGEKLDAFFREVYHPENGEESVGTERIVFDKSMNLEFESMDYSDSDDFKLSASREIAPTEEEAADGQEPLDEIKSIEISSVDGEIQSIDYQYFLINHHSDPSDTSIRCRIKRQIR